MPDSGRNAARTLANVLMAGSLSWALFGAFRGACVGAHVCVHACKWVSVYVIIMCVISLSLLSLIRILTLILNSHSLSVSLSLHLNSCKSLSKHLHVLLSDSRGSQRLADLLALTQQQQRFIWVSTLNRQAHVQPAGQSCPTAAAHACANVSCSGKLL